MSASIVRILRDSTFQTLTTTNPDPSTSSLHSFSSVPSLDVENWQQPQFQSHNGRPASIVININDDGSTGRGILIGILSAFGSAGVAVLVLAIFFFFRYTNKGRILLDRIGRPGEYDDEQAFAREEAEALESMDDLQRAEYLRAKGMWSPIVEGIANHSSLCTSKSARDRSDRHITVTIPRNSGEGSFCLGVRTRT